MKKRFVFSLRLTSPNYRTVIFLQNLKKEKERFRLKFPTQSKYNDKEECDRRLREYKQKSIVHHQTTVQPKNVAPNSKELQHT